MNLSLRIATALLLTVHLFPFRIYAGEKDDSVSVALSSIMAGYILGDMPENNDERESFIRGLYDARNELNGKEYYIGMLDGMTVLKRIKVMQRVGLPIDEEVVFSNLRIMLREGGTGAMTNEEANNIINRYFEENILKPDTFSIVSQKEFIDSIASLQNARKTPSGVVIVPILLSDTNLKPADGSIVLVSYEGRLSDGTVFDKTEEPIEMTVGKLVPGFNEGLKTMNVGDTIRLVIPSELGYGSQGAGDGIIPGNAALDFTITLEKITN